MSADLQGLVRQAVSAVERGDKAAARVATRNVLGHMGGPGLADQAAMNAALSGLGPVWAQCFGASVLAAAAELADAEPTARAYHDLGRQLVAHDAPAIASGLLGWASRLAPESETKLADYVGALELSGQHAAAVDALAGRHDGLRGRFTLDYLQAFNALMSRDIAGARAQVEGWGERDSANEVRLAGRLEGMLARAQALKGGAAPLDERDLRGWHLAMTGGVLLRLASKKTGEGAFNRRFGVHRDGPPVALEAVRKVAYLLGVFDIMVPAIRFYPDWGSAVLAHAAGKVFGKMPQTLTFPTIGPALLVVYDMEQLSPQEQAQLSQRQPGQILWTHAASYLRDHPVAGDLTTFLCRDNITPWRPDAAADPAGAAGAVSQTPFEMAADVNMATLYDDALADVPRVIRMCRALAAKAPAHGPSFLLDSGKRERQLVASPVPKPAT